MSSSKGFPWNQFEFCRQLVTMAVVIATLAAGTSSLEAVADDVPPVTAEVIQIHTQLHEGSVVKNELQAPREPEKENLTAPVPGNQDNSLPQPTFNSINTIGPSISNGVSTPTASGADPADNYAENYSITRNILTYPLNDPVNGQFSGQIISPLVLRESSDTVASTAPVVQSKYLELPLSFDDAKTRFGQLKLMAAGTRPQDSLEHVNQFIRWLSDIVDAHNKMSVAFNKNVATKPTGALEKQMSTKFAHLRYESQLLKADLLIQEHRYPEALAPLVEIVLAMPANAIGKAAYQRLQDLGFSTPDPLGSETTAAISAENEKTFVESKNKREPESPTSTTLTEHQKKVAMVSPGLHTKRQVTAKSASIKDSTNLQVKKAAKVTVKKSHKPN